MINNQEIYFFFIKMQFSKMHGLGNDFVIIDGIRQQVNLTTKKILFLSDRNVGIGFDQLLIVESSYYSDCDFHYRIFNADGSEVEQCGNGIRCLAYFLHLKKLTNKKKIYISTLNRKIDIFFKNKNKIYVNMGEPNFDPRLISFISKECSTFYVLKILKQKLLCSIVSIGNPHCVLIVDNINSKAISTIAPKLINHVLFPNKINVSFMKIIDRNKIILRIYERGSGKTRSSGSSASAAVAVGILQGLLSNNVQVNMLGGKLNIKWLGPGHSLYMIGSAEYIYDGFIKI